MCVLSSAIILKYCCHGKSAQLGPSRKKGWGFGGGDLIPAENHIGGKASSTTHIDGIDSKLQRSNSTMKKHFKALSFLSFIYENNSTCYHVFFTV